MRNLNAADRELVTSYMAAVYSCVGQMAFEEDGRQWSRNSFKEAREHPIRARPELLAKANAMVAPTIDHRRGRAVMAKLA